MKNQFFSLFDEIIEDKKKDGIWEFLINLEDKRKKSGEDSPEGIALFNHQKWMIKELPLDNLFWILKKISMKEKEKDKYKNLYNRISYQIAEEMLRLKKTEM